MVELVIPKTSFETLNRVLKAYYLTHSENGVSVKEVVQNTEYVEGQINKSNKFLLNIKFLLKEEGRFRLSNDGIQYVELIRKNQKQEASKILCKLIENYEGIKLITNYIEIYGDINKDDLVQKIAKISGSNTKINDHKVGINCLIEILLESRILIQENNQFTIGDTP